MNTDTFPIQALLPEIRRTLSTHTRLVLEAPPGAGKTTQVPAALLEEAWLSGRRILMLEPRRIATRMAAEFIAMQRGEAVGEIVGYRIRFESKVGPKTRIEVVTEGILTRMLQDNPELSDVGVILFDEFHERHLHGDLGLALALDVQTTLRPDLRLVVMSATLDGERIARWLDAPRLSSEGRSFPVNVVYMPARANEDWPFLLRRTVEKAFLENSGDILVFLPGKREIDRAKSTLASLSGNCECIVLHGELTITEQRIALSPHHADTRRIVLATNIAESSLTLPGVRVVIDTGLARELCFDPQSGLTRLETVTISQASADQRAGRAGRLGPGHCYRLWPESRRLKSARTPEIAQVELSSLALELAVWGSSQLSWLDPPPAGAFEQARDLLKKLEALDENNRLSTLGRAIQKLGALPRLGAVLLRTSKPLQALACDVVSLLEGRNPLRGSVARSDDFRQRVNALLKWRKHPSHNHGIDVSAMTTLEQAATAWRRRLALHHSTMMESHDQLAIGNLLVHAYPDRVARQDPNNPRRYQLSNGRGARLIDDSALFGEPWLVAIDLRFEERDSLILSAAPFDPDILMRDFIHYYTRCEVLRFDRSTRSIECFSETRFGDLVLERNPLKQTNADAMTAVLVAGIRDLSLSVLPWNEGSQNLRIRVACLRTWCPELGLPDLSDAALLATLEGWLAPYLHGKSRLASLNHETLREALLTHLDYPQQRLLDEHAPTLIRVPSGIERSITYTENQPPVLAVKLQELFGLADTPCIAKGRVPLTLHLLSPARRPIQVTQDLKSFWERTYPEVKKELKGRYPKHPWPDDPWSAVPTARAKPRR